MRNIIILAVIFKLIRRSLIELLIISVSIMSCSKAENNAADTKIDEQIEAEGLFTDKLLPALKNIKAYKTEKTAKQ